MVPAEAAAATLGRHLSEQTWKSASVSSLRSYRTSGAAVAVEDGRIIVLGGKSGKSTTILSSAESFKLLFSDRATDANTKEDSMDGAMEATLPCMRTPRYMFGAVAVPSASSPSSCHSGSSESLCRAIVAAGGFSTTQVGSECSSVELLDLDSETWKALPSMNVKRGGCAVVACCSAGGKYANHGGVCVVGGYGADDTGLLHDTVEYINLNPSVSLHEPVDSVDAKWAFLPSRMKLPRRNCAAVMLECAEVLVRDSTTDSQQPREANKSLHLVVMGGGTTDGRTTNAVECYSFRSRRWFELPPMTEGRLGCAAVAIDSCIFVLGGIQNDATTLATVEYFDFRTLKWTVLQHCMSRPRFGCCAVVKDEQEEQIIVALGGYDGSNHLKCTEALTVLKSTEALTVSQTSSLPKVRPRAGVGGHIELPLVPPVSDGYLVGSRDRTKALQEWCAAVEASLSMVKTEIRATMKSVASVKNEQVIAAQEDHDKKVSAAEKEYQLKVRSAREELVKRVEQAESEEEESVQRLRGGTSEWVDRTQARLEKGREELQTLLACRKNVAMMEQGKGAGESAGTTTAADSTYSTRLPPPPPALVCSLTLELMVDPVFAADGHTYERRAIERWFAKFPGDQNPTSPNTANTLPSRDLVPNVMAKSLCNEFREKNL